MHDYSLQYASIKANSKGNRCNMTWQKWNEKKGKPRVLQIKPHKEPPKTKVKVRNKKNHLNKHK